jgi:uncharacterized protein YciI
MSETPYLPVETRVVPNEVIPLKLFLCLARYDPSAGKALEKFFRDGGALPKDLAGSYAEHLRYHHNLGEKNRIWEAGPSADFTRFMGVYTTPDLGAAQTLLRDDPLLKQGILKDAWWMPWSVHTPYWKIAEPTRGMIEGLMRGMGILPTYPAGIQPPVREVRVNVVTPPRLFVSLARTDTERITKFEEDDKAGRPVPSFLYQHAWNRLGPGGSTQSGYEWEAGPLGDAVYDLTVYSVASVEMAKTLRENDPFTQNGLFHDTDDWFQWTIHYPFRKASPGIKAALAEQMKKAGLPVTG